MTVIALALRRFPVRSQTRNFIDGAAAVATRAGAWAVSDALLVVKAVAVAHKSARERKRTIATHG